MTVRPPSSLAQAVGELSAILEATYDTFLKMVVARRLGQPSRVLERQVERFIGYLGEIVHEHEGVDGDVAWAMALLNLRACRAKVEAEVIGQVEGARVVLDDEGRWLWKFFLGTLATSRVGLEWGMLGARDRRRWS